MVTIKEVAKLAGVSKATVSRVINNTVKVSQSKYDQVTKAMKQLDFKPNTLAQNLANKRSNALGVLVGNLTSPFYGLMLKGIEREAELAKMQLMVADGHSDALHAKKAIEFLIERKCDALVICQEMISNYDLRRWIDQGQLIVTINHVYSDLINHSIYLDSRAGGYSATQHLIDNGHSRIVHLTGLMSLQDSQFRLQGYKNALEKNKIEYDKALILEGNFTESSGYDEVRKILKQKVPFTAIFAANDQMASGAMAAVYDANLKIPDDISIVGFDDLILARYLYPALTTIRQPIVEMGRAGAQLAICSIAGKPVDHIERKFQPQLIKRKSVARIL